MKMFSSECHQQEMAPGDFAAVTSEQPHQHEPGFFMQPHPSLTSLMPVDVHSHCGEGSSLRSPLICVKDQEQKPKNLQKDPIAKPSPPAQPGQAVIADNTFRISKREVIYPSQGRPRTAVMLCGCPGYAMMSFQRRNQRLASV